MLSRDSLVALAAFVFACASMFLLHGMSRLRGAGVETLVLFVPVVFSLVHGREKNRAAAGETSHVV